MFNKQPHQSLWVEDELVTAGVFVPKNKQKNWGGVHKRHREKGKKGQWVISLIHTVRCEMWGILNGTCNRWMDSKTHFNIKHQLLKLGYLLMCFMRSDSCDTHHSPDDGVETSNLWRAFQHTESLRQRLGLMGRGQERPVCACAYEREEM